MTVTRFCHRSFLLALFLYGIPSMKEIRKDHWCTDESKGKGANLLLGCSKTELYLTCGRVGKLIYMQLQRAATSTQEPPETHFLPLLCAELVQTPAQPPGRNPKLLALTPAFMIVVLPFFRYIYDLRKLKKRLRLHCP